MWLSLLGLLRNPIAAAVVALAVGFSGGFFKGHDSASDACRESNLRAQLVAERDKARRLSEIRDRQETRIADLQHALEQINDESPITGDGADVRLGPDFMCRLRAKYNPDIGCDPALPGRRE